MRSSCAASNGASEARRRKSPALCDGRAVAAPRGCAIVARTTAVRCRDDCIRLGRRARVRAAEHASPGVRATVTCGSGLGHRRSLAGTTVCGRRPSRRSSCDGHPAAPQTIRNGGQPRQRRAPRCPRDRARRGVELVRCRLFPLLGSSLDQSARRFVTGPATRAGRAAAWCRARLMSDSLEPASIDGGCSLLGGDQRQEVAADSGCRSREVAATVAVSQRIHRWMEVREVSLDSVEHHRWFRAGSAPRTVRCQRARASPCAVGSQVAKNHWARRDRPSPRLAGGLETQV